MKTCCVEGCNGKHYAHGFCNKHYQQFRKHQEIKRTVYDKNDYIFHDTLKVLKENLSDIEYNILSLHLFSELTFKEISSKLNMKESSVKTLYFRTLKKSRKLLERR